MPDLKLRTAYNLKAEGRIVSTREPEPMQGPLFTLIRTTERCAWAVHASLPAELAAELDRAARDEPPALDLEAQPVHAERYRALVHAHLASQRADAALSERAGSVFRFPAILPRAPEIVLVDDERLLQRHFRGWVPGEIAAGRAPLLAIVEDGYPVSVCFCAHSSHEAADAGLETAAAYRGRGLAVRVTAAWALAIRATGRLPIYSTDFRNHASRAVARKLGLVTCASTWSLSD